MISPDYREKLALYVGTLQQQLESVEQHESQHEFQLAVCNSCKRPQLFGRDPVDDDDDDGGGSGDEPKVGDIADGSYAATKPSVSDRKRRKRASKRRWRTWSYCRDYASPPSRDANLTSTPARRGSVSTPRRSPKLVCVDRSGAEPEEKVRGGGVDVRKMYYSLSPLLVDDNQPHHAPYTDAVSTLRWDDAGDDLNDVSDVSRSSSVDAKPEYFAVISKRSESAQSVMSTKSADASQARRWTDATPQRSAPITRYPEFNGHRESRRFSPDFRDGYCTCDFCRRDDVFSSAAVRTDDTPPPPPCSVHEDDDASRRRRICSSCQSPPQYLQVYDLFCNCQSQTFHERESLQQDIEKHSSGVASVLNLCEVLLHDGDACSTDSERDSIRDATNSLDRRWRNICAVSIDRRLKIEDTQRLWKKFLADFARFCEWLERVEWTASHPNTGMVCYDHSKTELRKFETLQREVHEGLTQLELINKQYRRLARENRTDASNELKKMVHDGNSRWDGLTRRIGYVLRRVKHVINRREVFDTQRESLLVWLTEMDLQLTNLEHFATGSDRDKLQQLEEFKMKILERIQVLQQLDDSGRVLVEKGEEKDAVEIEKEMDDFHDYCLNVMQRLNRYNSKLHRIATVSDSSFLSDVEDEMQNFVWWSPPSLDPTDPVAAKRARPGLLDEVRNRETPMSMSSLEWDGYDSHQQLDDDDSDDVMPSPRNYSAMSSPNYDDILLHNSPTRDPSPAQVVEGLKRYSPMSISQLHSDNTTSAVEKKKPRHDHDDVSKGQQAQLNDDLDAVIKWLTAKQLTSLAGSRRGEFTIEDLDEKIAEVKQTQRELESRKPLVLSINLVTSRRNDVTHDSAAEDDVDERVKLMNDEWRALQTRVLKRREELQRCMVQSDSFQRSVAQLRQWIDEQNRRREQLSATLRPSVVAPSLHALRRTHKSLVELRVETLEARVQAASLQEVCNQLLYTDARARSLPPVDGALETADRIADVTSHLKALLDRIGEDLQLSERQLKDERYRMRSGSTTSEADSLTSNDASLHSSSPLKLKMMRRKEEKAVDAESFDKATESDATNASTWLRDRVSSTCDVAASLHFNGDGNCSSVDELTSIPTSSSSNVKSSFMRRSLLAALPFYASALVAYLWFASLDELDDEQVVCLRRNNLYSSVLPTLSFTRGPPPM